MADQIASESQLAQLLKVGENYDAWLAWLKSVRPRYVGTPMQAKIDAAIADGEKTKSGIASVLTSVRDAWTWIKETGSGALDYLKQATGLGFLPAIPAVWAYGLGAAAVTGAVTTMGYWIGSASNLKKELDVFDANVKRAIDAGANPQDAIAAASAAVTGIVAGETARGETGGIGSELARQGGKIALWALLAWGAYKIAQRQGWLK